MPGSVFFGEELEAFNPLDMFEMQKVVAEIDKSWEDMDPDNCDSIIGKELVSRLRKRRFHLDEAEHGMI